MEWFWSANRNKVNLELLLHQTAIKHARETLSSLKVFVSVFSSESVEVPCFYCCDGYCRDIPELCIDIEEADTRIIPHALHAVEHGLQRLVVLSPDTDVFVLLLFLLGCTVWKGPLWTVVQSYQWKLPNIFQYILLRQIKGLTYAKSFPLWLLWLGVITPARLAQSKQPLKQTQ